MAFFPRGIIIGQNDIYSIFERLADLPPTGGRSIRVGVNDPYSILLAILLRMETAESAAANGSVIRRSPDGTAEIYTATANTDAARGVALASSIADATSGDLLEVGPGTFETAPFAWPAGVQANGAGSFSTTLKSSTTGVLITGTTTSGTFTNMRITGAVVSAGTMYAQNVIFDTVAKAATAALAMTGAGVIRGINCVFQAAASQAPLTSANAVNVYLTGSAASYAPDSNVTVKPEGGLAVHADVSF